MPFPEFPCIFSEKERMPSGMRSFFTGMSQPGVEVGSVIMIHCSVIVSSRRLPGDIHGGLNEKQNKNHRS